MQEDVATTATHQSSCAVSQPLCLDAEVIHPLLTHDARLTSPQDAAPTTSAPMAVDDHANQHYLELCVKDLLQPTAKAERLLETLTTEQLTVIENTLFKIREKKTLSDAMAWQTPQVATDACDTAEQQQQQTQQQQQQLEPSASEEHHRPDLEPSTTDDKDKWDWVASLVAKALLNSVTGAALNKGPPVAPGDESVLSTGASCMAGDTHALCPLPGPASTLLSTTLSSTTGTTGTTGTTWTDSSASTSDTLLSHHEPVVETRDGVEWVSFVYSHHRILRRYCIRTDIDQVDISQLDEKFKRENCVYPRANLPRETYAGNRWAYETECNLLGWKLAWLNAGEIAGKRGLIQRAVDSYRNRYPSMRSRRVARQEKLLNGTLRKRKHRDLEDTATPYVDTRSPLATANPNKQLKSSLLCLERQLPKTIMIDIDPPGTKCRIRVNIDTVPLEAIDVPFRKNNCVFPRAMGITTETPGVTQRQLDEAKCNEMGWKLAWLNPRQLANKKCLLQRVLDMFRTKFTPELPPRKYASRNAPSSMIPSLPHHESTGEPVKLKLTAETLAAQQRRFIQQSLLPRDPDALDDSHNHDDDDQSIYSGTTVSLDFHDCFSPPAEALDSPVLDHTLLPTSTPPSDPDPSPTPPYLLDNAFALAGEPHPLLSSQNPALCFALNPSNPDKTLSLDDMSCRLSVESGCSSSSMSMSISMSSISTSSSNPSNQNSPHLFSFLAGLGDVYPQPSLLDASTVISEAPLFDMTLFGDPLVTFKDCPPLDLADSTMSTENEPFAMEQDALLNNPEVESMAGHV